LLGSLARVDAGSRSRQAYGHAVQDDFAVFVEAKQRGKIFIEEAAEVETSEPQRRRAEIEILGNMARLQQQVSIAAVLVFPKGSFDDRSQHDYGSRLLEIRLTEEHFRGQQRGQRVAPHNFERMCDRNIMIDTARQRAHALG
jgi:hypothetical protein